VLKYQFGQKYDAHHDVGEIDSKSGAQLAVWSDNCRHTVI